MSDSMAREREFTLAEARDLIPAVVEQAAEIIKFRANLAELELDLRTKGSSALGGMPESKAYEARVDEALGWFVLQGIEVKGLGPLLVDFPARLGGRSVRLCWLEGETELGWYHLTELGFAGRRRLP